MKISDKAIKKAEEIQKQIVKDNKEEMEMQEAKSFAKQYGICPQCAIPLNEVKSKLRFFTVPSINKHTKRKCKNCGFEVIWEETYY